MCAETLDLYAFRAQIHARDRCTPGQGDAQQILDYVLDEARKSGVQRVSLETGTVPFFAPARRFYERNGFTHCEPFGDYELDPYSCFMTREI